MKTITSYTKFIHDSIPEIRGYFQEPFSWRYYSNKKVELAIIKEMKAKHKDFAMVIDRLDDELCREKVRRYYEEDVYTGFIATLMWGWYHKGNTRRYLDTVLSVDKDKIERSLAKVDKLLSENRIQEAFLALESGDCHIKGIGTSFLTKIMYFLGKDKSLPEQPLIYDNVMRWVHTALLIEDKSVDEKEYYTLQKDSLHRSKKDVELYMDYVKRMNQISKSHDIAPDQLEAFLFRKDSRDITPKFVQAASSPQK